jgi:peptidoglycan/xylan/chitin deacetylase (PgdA/CDA1 family)
MTVPPAHASVPKRVMRILARTIGVPLGTAAMLFLRLSGRKAGIALMYHSVEQRAGDPLRELVPPHHADVFGAQVRHLARRYRIVPAAELPDAVARRRRGERFPVAITFDDDLACHAEIALPILVRQGATATFFLSGASLERPFAFWYERLQRAYDKQLEGLAELVLGEATARGERGEPTLHELALAVEELDPDERDAVADRLAAALGSDPETAGIRAGQVRALADAAMTIGFHTQRHDALSLLDDERLDAALVDGRDALAEAAGQAVDVIGYPHGRADARVADHARAAGFTAGFSTRPVAVTPDADPLLQGRIAPTFWSVGGLAIQLALTLRRA